MIKSDTTADGFKVQKDRFLVIVLCETDATGIRLWVNTCKLRCKKMSFKEKTWGIPLLDHLLSFIIFFLKPYF